MPAPKKKLHTIQTSVTRKVAAMTAWLILGSAAIAAILAWMATG